MIDVKSPVLIATIWTILLIPIILLASSWIACLRAGPRVNRKAKFVLAALTVSYVFLGLSVCFKSTILGVDYSMRLFRTIELNLFLNLALLPLSLLWTRGSSAVRLMSAIACLLVALAWYYVLVVNSVA